MQRPVPSFAAFPAPAHAPGGIVRARLHGACGSIPLHPRSAIAPAQALAGALDLHHGRDGGAGPTVSPDLLRRGRAVLRWLQSTVRHGLAPLEAWMDAAFGAAANPFHYLGALTIFFFWIVLVTGIYLYVFYHTSVHGAYASVEYLTRQQWYLGGVLRSLHRYAADAAVITLTLHLIRHFAYDHFRGAHRFSWLTGVPTLWLVAILGITGYWLVWDRLAQYLAVLTTELLDRLPVFAAPIARNFLTPDSLSDRFFTLLAFLHFLSLPLLLAGFIWLHLQRISRPVINPPRPLAVGTLLALLALALLHPAHSQGPANLASAPTTLHLDWFYLSIYPLAGHTPPAFVWTLLFASTLLLCLLPWLPRAAHAPAAVVTPRWCNGCGRCVDDCPFNAITLAPRPAAGKPRGKIAVVNPALCAACGICAGACPSSTPFRRVEELVSGIDLPDFTIDRVRTVTGQRLAALRAPVRIMVFGCRYAARVEALRSADVAVLTLPCSAMLPPSFIEYLLRRRRAEGIVITGCAAGECNYRLGNRWVEERLARRRAPYLRPNVPRERIALIWAAAGEEARVAAAVERLRRRLRSATLRTAAGAGLEAAARGGGGHG